MLTKENALALWRKLASYPPEVIRTKRWRQLADEAADLVEKLDGKQEAEVFRNMLDVAESYP